MNFGEKIKELRNKQNWTQDYVSKELNISTAALSRYESGSCEPKDLEMLSRFAKLYNVSTDYLLGLSPNRHLRINKIKELRAEKGITQADLAKILKISDRAVGYYENGDREPDYKTLLKIAEYFDVSIDYLLDATSDNREANSFYSTFIKQLSILLQENNITQRELAKEINVTEVTISRYLSGERIPRLEIINEIADFFKVSIDYLLGKSNSRCSSKSSYKRDWLVSFCLDFENLSEADKDVLMATFDAFIKARKGDK